MGEQSRTFNNDKSSLLLIESLTHKLNKKERELRLANERFTRLFEHSPLGMMITVNRVITFANKRMHLLTGYKEPELIGQSTRVLYNSDQEYEAMGKTIQDNKEFHAPINLKNRMGGTTACMLKFTKCDTENYVSVYIEAEAGAC
jgi:PAS domain S-box-containing protein